MLNIDTTTLFDPLIEGIRHFLPKIPIAIAAFLLGWVIIKLLSWFFRFLLTFVRMPRGLKSIVHSMIDALLWIFLIIGILQVLGLNNVALAFSGAIIAVGVALGNGASTLASDILAGIFLARDRDFSIGDTVKAGEGTEGIVENMDMRRIRIRDKGGHLHVIPNSVIERKEWVLINDKAKDGSTK